MWKYLIFIFATGNFDFTNFDTSRELPFFLFGIHQNYHHNSFTYLLYNLNSKIADLDAELIDSIIARNGTSDQYMDGSDHVYRIPNKEFPQLSYLLTFSPDGTLIKVRDELYHRTYCLWPDPISMFFSHLHLKQAQTLRFTDNDYRDFRVHTDKWSYFIKMPSLKIRTDYE